MSWRSSQHAGHFTPFNSPATQSFSISTPLTDMQLTKTPFYSAETVATEIPQLKRLDDEAF
jgi:hypothetical protein